MINLALMISVEVRQTKLGEHPMERRVIGAILTAIVPSSRVTKPLGRRSGGKPLRVLPAVMLVCSLLPVASHAQLMQQGTKLVGRGAIGDAFQGSSVALSGNGSTAIVGGPGDDNSAGAAWVYTRTNGVWSRQAKIVGTGAVGGGAEQGYSASLSADGNTAIIGGPFDETNGFAGAAWVFTRPGRVWSQQAKLVGTDQIGFGGEQGVSVALSADGNTAIVGAPFDNASAGTAWVYIRSGGVWSQQAKLVGTDTNGSAMQGVSVSASSDGNTAIVGGPGDNGQAGAAWVFTRAGSVWSQQGPKLVGTGAVGSVPANQGSSVALSGDGNTAIVGGPRDDSVAGAAWVYTRTNGVWNQEGPKLVATGTVSQLAQGSSVSLSDDGNTAVVGGPGGTTSTAGAAWVFTRSGGVWNQQEILVGTGAVGGGQQGWSVSISGDGSTAISGGLHDNGGVGAAWVFAPYAGAPGAANCYAQSTSILVQEFGGLNAAAAGLGFPSIGTLQNSILVFCGG